jgi:hypothetical protein
MSDQREWIENPRYSLPTHCTCRAPMDRWTTRTLHGRVIHRIDHAADCDYTPLFANADERVRTVRHTDRIRPL